MEPLKYLAGYPQDLQERVRALIAQDGLAPMLAKKYAEPHAVRSDGQLYDYVQALKDSTCAARCRWARWSTTARCR